MDSKRILYTMCASPLMGMDRKECYRFTHPLLKISGYATACKYVTPASMCMSVCVSVLLNCRILNMYC